MKERIRERMRTRKRKKMKDSERDIFDEMPSYENRERLTETNYAYKVVSKLNA